jgi:hypothetical protein
MKHSSTLYVDTPVYVPEIEDEAIRDLSQARERLIFQLRAYPNRLTRRLCYRLPMP